MFPSLAILLALGAFVISIVSAVGKVPLWPAVLLLSLAVLLLLGFPTR